ncbi:MAG: chain-length determining protein [Sphingomonadales bacterium]|nr:chain-length determining protein [Sphingomonadales bacterium]
MNGIYEEIRLALHGIWQRRWLALAVAWGIAILGWVVIALIPNSYESRSKVYVQTQSALANEVGISERDQRAMVERIRQTLASTANLEAVVRGTDLAEEAASDEEVRAMAARLRPNVTVVAQQDPDAYSQQGNMFEIATRWSGGGFSDGRSARLARQINQELLDALVEDNLAGNREEAESSVAFLDRQIEQRERALRELEQQRMQFEDQFAGLIPGTGSIADRISQARVELRNVESDLAAAQSSLSTVQAQMNAVPATVPVPGSVAAGPATARLNALQQQLAEARGRGWTDSHPDVVALESQITRARAQARGERGGGGASASNPLHMSLQSMLADRQSQVAALTAQRDRLRSAIEQISRREASDPNGLAEQQQVERDYQTALTQYRELVADRETIRLRGDVTTETDSSQIRIVNPPSSPGAPVAPNRPLLLVLVLVAAIAGGVGTAFAQSQLRTTYATASRLAAQTGLPVLGAVGDFLRPDRLAENRRLLRRFAAAGAGLFGVFTLLMAVEFVQRGLVA